MLVLDQLGRLFTNFYQYSQIKVYLLKVFKACVRSVLLYESETWPLSTEDLSRIERYDHATICWLCNVKIEQKHSTEDLRRRIHVHYIEDVFRWNRLRLSGHLYRQEETSWTKKILSFNVDGPTSRGRPRIGGKMWLTLIYAKNT